MCDLMDVEKFLNNSLSEEEEVKTANERRTDTKEERYKNLLGEWQTSVYLMYLEMSFE